MGEGIVFKIGTSDFDEAVKLCEQAFDDCNTKEWEFVKKSKDFQMLSDYLTAYDIDHEVFAVE